MFEIYWDMNLPVYKEVPADGLEIDYRGFIKDWDRLLANQELIHNQFYYCCDCEGYIKGVPTARQENSMGFLCGRYGEAYCCIRCGSELGFNGMVS